ncbi:hypothetical protein D3C87_1536850 [compost metagenome]
MWYIIAELLFGQVRRIATQKIVYNRYCRSTVHIIISEDHDFLPVSYGLVNMCYGRLHSFHEERIMQMLQLWPEEVLGRSEITNASLSQQAA